MGKKGPPYKPPDDAQWIVVLKPPHIIQDGGIDYTPLEYWLRALFSDQRAATFIYKLSQVPGLAAIVELPGPDELPIPTAAYGQHSLRLGLKRRPWFNHDTGFTAILPYNFEHMGHPEETRGLNPMISGLCEDEWLKFDLAIPYPTPRRFDFGSVPQEVRKFCRRIPDATPPPPDSMQIERYPTPPAQEPQRVQNFQQASQLAKEQPLFIPDNDSKFKIKSLDPYQEEESLSSFLREPSSTIDTSRGVKPEPRLEFAAQRSTFDANEIDRESNVLSSRGDQSGRLTAANDEPGNNRLSAKREFANQDHIESRKIHDLLQATNRSQSPSVDDRLAVKRELENQDGASAREMYEVLDAVNRNQSVRVDGPSSGTIKRGSETQEVEPGEYNSSRNPGSGPHIPGHPVPDRDRDRDGSKQSYRPTFSPNPNTSTWGDRNERVGRERERERDNRAWSREGERGRVVPPRIGSDRKRSFAYPDERDDRGSSVDRREYPDKRSRSSYQ